MAAHDPRSSFCRAARTRLTAVSSREGSCTTSTRWSTRKSSTAWPAGPGDFLMPTTPPTRSGGTSGPSRHNLRTRTWVTARNHRRITAPHTRTFNHGTALVQFARAFAETTSPDRANPRSTWRRPSRERTRSQLRQRARGWRPRSEYATIAAISITSVGMSWRSVGKCEIWLLEPERCRRAPGDDLRDDGGYRR